MLKKFIICLLFLEAICLFSVKANSFEDLYEEQFQNSGASEMMKSVPKPTLKSLENMGIRGKSLKELFDLNVNKIFEEAVRQAKETFLLPFKCTLPVIAIILLNSLVDGIGISIGNKNLSDIMAAVSSASISVTIINPIVKCISATASVIKAASDFIICFAPVMSGIMLASGQSVSASSYQIMMLGAGKLISNLCSDFLIPMMSAMLGISIISSISTRLKLGNLCDGIYKITKWILWASTCIFTIMLTIQNLVSSSADNITNKTAKLAFSSFVPIVGGALGDAYSTVHSCIKLLKSGIGAFAVLIGGAIFIPAVIQCCSWIFFLTVCHLVSEIFALESAGSLLKSCTRVMQLLLAVILSCVTALIASTIIILLIGNMNSP